MQKTSTSPVYEAAIAYQTTAALIAAVKMDIFTTIGSGAMTAEELGSRTAASTRGTRILCDFLTVIGLLEKKDSRYSLPPTAQVFLDGASPLAMGGIVDFVAAPEMVALFFEDPAGMVRRGGSKGLANVAPDHPIWPRFAKAMTPIAATTARLVGAHVASLPESPSTVLDVASGHGLYGVELAKVLPNALITAIDWAEVLRVTRANAEAAGVDERFRLLAGNALELDWGRGYELILLPNILHHFDAETCVSLLRKAKSALAPGGRALGVDFVPNEDRVSPPAAAMFAFWMLASTPGGDAYTARDYDGMARSAGFGGAVTRPLPPTPESLIIFQD
jgi:ubiquinone/menaquinone biosynthesis C-methylase UbiE